MIAKRGDRVEYERNTKQADGKWAKQTFTGTFQEWSHEVEQGAAYPVAIVIHDDGTVWTPVAHTCRFVGRRET
jgi:hypothetical protein